MTLIASLEVSSLNIATLGNRASIYKSEEDTNFGHLM